MAAPQERPDRVQAAAETAAALAREAAREHGPRDGAAREQAKAQTAPAEMDCKRGARYLLASAVMLRKPSDPDSAAVARLPIGAEVEGGCAENGWVRVWAKDHSGLIGWVRSDLMSMRRPTLEALLDESRALPAADREGRLRIAERALALAPFDERAHRLRIDALREVGERAALVQAERALAELRRPQVRRDKDEPRLIFAYDGEVLSPLATLTERGLQDGPYSAADGGLPVGDPRRAPAYFRPGRVYHYYRGGADAGLLRVLGKTEPSCESDVALVQRVGADGAQPLLAGIATNFALRPSAKAAIAEPDAGERQLLERLLREALSKQGLSKRKTDAALDPARDAAGSGPQYAAALWQARGPRVLIASVRAYFSEEEDRDDTHAQAYALLIVELDRNGKHRVVHREAEVGEGGESSHSARYLDHLDLDGDGRNELIFMQYGYESWGYQVWRRGKSEWKAVANGGGGGC
ncbi:hypothetical protein ASD69_14085 [Lysobacter sp. Root604]|nr:hypothetical protein ASD69_14085 [Lysobacter sp. Root604]